ncbi:MAG: restriction endonuclease subunit R, partial [Bacteroidetes bacterium]
TMPEWISRDIKAPKFFTVCTYQALHAVCSGLEIDEDSEEAEEITGDNSQAEEIIKLLRFEDVVTLILDEAHHLKNAWWQTLIRVKESIKPTVVGLTATPPYDSSYSEWKRYLELNGPVDAEISVPELVMEGDLCPHQDYVYFSLPMQEEFSKINEYRLRIKDLYNELKQDTTLISALSHHMIFKDPLGCTEWIYSNIESYSATLIFLKSAGLEIKKDHLRVIGSSTFTVPKLNYEWMERVLTFYLFKDSDQFSSNEDHQKSLILKLKRSGALSRQSIEFKHHPKIDRALRTSISKLSSIETIVEFEHRQLKKDLRMVVLTDYIRKDFLINSSTNDLDLNKIGVLPIFEKLRRKNDKDIKLGVLTGSLIILPVSAIDKFKTIAAKYHLDEIPTTPVPYDTQYLIVNSPEKLKHEIVHIVTEVFQTGHIEVLIGTQSLLGEGWDAPSINSLILASFVGSYVTSNQMRGRAIRSQLQDIEKTGNIWHLVCLDPTREDGGDDVQLLKRRFKAFVGVSFRAVENIENGYNRLNLPEYISSAEDVREINRKTLSAAKEREKLKTKWHLALKEGVKLVEEIKVPFEEGKDYRKTKGLYFNRTIRNLLVTFGSAVTWFSIESISSVPRLSQISHSHGFKTALTYLCIAAFFSFGALGLKYLKVYLKYRDITKDFAQISEAVLITLIKAGIIRTKHEELKLATRVDEDGVVYCHLEGGTTYERSVYIKAIQEVLSPVHSPKYLIIRKSFWRKLIFGRSIRQVDYHPVPEILCRNKKRAQHFATQWGKYVGSCELVYTRTLEGRKVLLKSRMNSLASEFLYKSERVNKWL